jgi:hypothetical protein
MDSARKNARIAGLLYLIMAILGAFSIVWVPSILVVPGDVTSTVANIEADEWLFRLGIFSGLACQAIFVFLVVELHRLLKGVSRKNALLMVAFVVASVPISCLNMINQFAVLLILGDGYYLSVFDAEQLDALAMLFLDLHARGVLIAEIFWGLWLLPFGLLVIKSIFIPRILGIFLVIGGFCYLTAVLVHVLFPGYAASIEQIVVTLSGIAEFSIILWLLIIGVRDQKPAV